MKVENAWRVDTTTPGFSAYERTTLLTVFLFYFILTEITSGFLRVPPIGQGCSSGLKIALSGVCFPRSLSRLCDGRTLIPLDIFVLDLCILSCCQILSLR